jgi:Flp pilus assembly pilin Flp
MLKNLIQDESGLSTIEILVGMIVLVLLAIISFAALRVGVKDAASNVGSKTATNMVNNSVGSAGTDTDGKLVSNDPNVEW